MKKMFAALATVAAALVICACAGNDNNKPNYDQTRARAEGAYTEADN